MKFCLIVIFLLSNWAIAQKNERIPKLETLNWFGETSELKMHSYRSKIIIPTTLMVAGIALNGNSTKTKLQTSFLAPFNGYQTSLDDYIQYAPIVQMYGFDFLKLPSRNNMWNQTKYLVMSELITAGVVHLLKHTLKIQRPDGGALTSFPSGHTGQAFVASQVLFNEFYRTRPVLALSGYAFSVSTGALRIINNRHWVPDVLMGAGLAILVTNTIYYLEPLKNWDPFHKTKSNLSFYTFPRFSNDTYGLQMKIVF